MGPVAITERFAAVCSPVHGTSYDTCGTVTRSTINHLTVTQLNALFAPGGLFADLDAWFVHAIEMKACGVRRYLLYDWIMANADMTQGRAALSGIKTVKGPSLLHPFIMAKTESVTNRGHFKLINGYAVGSYTGGTTGPLTTEQLAMDTLTSNTDKRVIRVEPRHDIPVDPNWFRPRDSIHIFTRTSGGALQHGQWRAIASAIDANLTYIDVLIENGNAGSTEGFNSTPGASATTGYIVPGKNNVNDFERWCTNLPNIDPRKRVPFWIQTMRESRCVDSEYRLVYKRLYDSNPAFREFGDLPMAERNRQDELESQQRFVNDFFYNKPISQKQTLPLWDTLDNISTPDGLGLVTGLGGKLIAKRANFVGAREQLRVCDRVFDLTNQALNLNEFLRLNYDIKRARESRAGSRKVERLDWWTSSQYRAVLFDGFLAYYKQLYGTDVFRITYSLDNRNDDIGVTWDMYKVKWPSGLEIAIMSDEYFDDRRNEFSAGLGSETAGNLLLCLDIGKPGAGSMYWSMIASNRRTTTTADINQLAKLDSTFRCVLETVSIEQTLKSDTGTVVVDCPLHSAWIENFTDTTPIVTGENYQSGGVLGTPSGYSNLYLSAVTIATAAVIALKSLASLLF